MTSEEAQHGTGCALMALSLLIAFACLLLLSLALSGEGEPPPEWGAAKLDALERAPV